MDEENTAGKCATSPINGAQIPLGAHPGNTGGKPGRSGRKPDAFKAALAKLADATVKRGYVEQILTDPHHPQFMKALEWATDRGYGKVAQAVDVTSGDKPLRFTLAIGERDGDD